MLIRAPQNTVAHEAQEVEFPEVVLMSQGCVEGAADTSDSKTTSSHSTGALAWR